MINPNEAPEGYEAVEYVGIDPRFDRCDDCAFIRDAQICAVNPCFETFRSDRTTVYFVRRTSVTSVMSKLLHPMGSLGEEV